MDTGFEIHQRNTNFEKRDVVKIGGGGGNKLPTTTTKEKRRRGIDLISFYYLNNYLTILFKMYNSTLINYLALPQQ